MIKPVEEVELRLEQKKRPSSWAGKGFASMTAIDAFTIL
jgi:hypothetical protein